FFISCIPFLLAIYLFSNFRGENALLFFLMVLCGILLGVAPLAALVYNSQKEYLKQINVLKTESSRSKAGLDFLRSQINPHFLFNALNTLYATALQENAGKTSEGIQKLGDLMRFMLHEYN